MQKIILTKKQQQEAAKLAQKPLPVVYAGRCAGCHGQIPITSIYVASKYIAKSFGAGWRVSVPNVIWHRACYVAPKQSKKQPEPIKDLAKALYHVMPRDGTPHGSQWLARAADLPYTENIKIALRKLRKLNRVKFENGKWSRTK